MIDIKPLGNLVNLGHLSIGENQINDIEHLLKLVNSQELRMIDNKLNLGEGSRDMEIIKLIEDRGTLVYAKPSSGGLGVEALPHKPSAQIC